MTDKLHVVVVCGYGCHVEPDNHFVQGYRRYIDKIRKFAFEHNVNLLILCGGVTQLKSAGNVSEASVILGEMMKSDDPEWVSFYPTKVKLEQDSMTTLDNIHNAVYLIRKTSARFSSKYKITIFCEAHRAPLVIMLARHFMVSLVESIDDITVETGSWERADPFKQAGNLVRNKLAITFPWLGIAERESRKRRQRALSI